MRKLQKSYCINQINYLSTVQIFLYNYFGIESFLYNNSNLSKLLVTNVVSMTREISKRSGQIGYISSCKICACENTI